MVNYLFNFFVGNLIPIQNLSIPFKKFNLFQFGNWTDPMSATNMYKTNRSLKPHPTAVSPNSKLQN